MRFPSTTIIASMRTGHPNRQCDQARNLPKIKSSSFCLLCSTHSLASSILIASSWSPLNRKIPFHIFKFRAKTFVYDISRQRVFVCYFRPPPAFIGHSFGGQPLNSKQVALTTRANHNIEPAFSSAVGS